jgi:uncharacterized membrane protein
MIDAIITFILTLILFISFDLIWFSISLSNIYLPKFTEIQGSAPPFFSKISGGIFAWILLALGIITFVIPKSNTVSDAILYGLLFGLIVYGVYNGTSYVTLEKYDINIMLPDLIWGTVVSGVISGIIYYVRMKNIPPLSSQT